MSCGTGRRHSSDLALLWLRCRPAATAPIRPLAWELSCAMGAALKRQKKKISVIDTLYLLCTTLFWMDLWKERWN